MESIASKDLCIREQTVHEAFQNKGGKTWRELQFLLFGMNLRMMRDGFRLGTEQARKDWALRNMIESIEQQYLTKETIPEDVATAEEFMAWLKERIYGHRVNHSPLFELFDADDLSDEELRFFLANYRVNMQRFHLHVAAYSLIVTDRRGCLQAETGIERGGIAGLGRRWRGQH